MELLKGHTNFIERYYCDHLVQLEFVFFNRGDDIKTFQKAKANISNINKTTLNFWWHAASLTKAPFSLRRGFQSTYLIYG